MQEHLIKLRKKMKKVLDESRYEHTLGVMYTAASLAMRYDENIEKALCAGLLHDCAKCIDLDEKLRLCAKYDISLSSYEQENPALIHAKLGAVLAKKKYHVKDEEILRAIRSHTTGRPGMTTLEKIVYIADYMEPDRRMLPNMKEVRRLAYTDLNACLYRILEDSLVYLESRNLTVDPATKETYLYYQKELGKDVTNA